MWITGKKTYSFRKEGTFSVGTAHTCFLIIFYVCIININHISAVEPKEII